ncbi:MAG: hypothetical protein P8M72_10635 [Gammaproteobacteria bacterium]|nr:hypothetical protein [Gammaproteobacteria bacterium]
MSSFASAQVTYSTSVGVGAQTDNAVVTAGGGSVRANNLMLVTAGADIAADDEIVVRLPDGINFVGEPSYLATRAGGAAAVTGLTLQDGTAFTDPTLDDPGITLSDTNEDGGMDRALVTVSSASVAGDSLTISINVTANAGVTVGTYEASVIVSGNLAVTQDLVEVIATDIDPVGQGGTAVSVSQAENLDEDTSGAGFAITIPAGAAGRTVTLTPATGVSWGTTVNGSTVTWTVHTPLATGPFTVASGAAVGPQSATTAVTLTTDAITTVDVQVAFEIDSANSLNGAVGLRQIAIAGTAGVSGNVSLFNALANGSEATLSAAPAASDVVAGSDAPQTLPTIEVEENFFGDLGGSFTITAGTGLTFITGGSVSATGVTGTISVNAASTVITVTMIPANRSSASDTITISGITGIAGSTASGDLSVTVDSSDTFAEFGPKTDALTVANAVPVGTVAVAIAAAQVNDVGGDAYQDTSTVTLQESTYGALTRAAADAGTTSSQEAFLRVTPSSNADIDAITITDTGYAAGASPTITACVAESAGSSSLVCVVTAESTAAAAGTSTISVAIQYTTDGAAIGEEVTMTLGGNAGVEETTLTVANVVLTTSASVTGVIPDLNPGDTEASDLATFTIDENFDGAVTLAEFRLIAPSGVAFQDAGGIAAQSAGIATATITATFAPNDTLVMTAALTESISVTAKAVIAGGASGKLSFDIVDGNIDGLRPTGANGEAVILAHAGSLAALDAGDDAAVSIGFTIANTVTGGLAGYTVASDTTGVATAAIDGDTVTVTGVTAGGATITVTDDLNATSTYDVTVAAGAAQPAATKDAVTVSGAETAATFAGGATKDGGTTFGTEFTTADDVTLVGTINVDPADVGLAGEVYVAILSVVDTDDALSYLDEDGNLAEWNGSIAGLGAHIVATSLDATYNITIYSGNVAAGTHRVSLGYLADGELVYTAKAMTITVTE